MTPRRLRIAAASLSLLAGPVAAQSWEPHDLSSPYMLWTSVRHVEDFDGDGLAEYIYVETYPGFAFLSMNNLANSGPGLFINAGMIGGIVSGDADGDGDQDLFIKCDSVYVPGSILYYENLSELGLGFSVSTLFQDATIFDSQPSCAADMDGDGDEDLIGFVGSLGGAVWFERESTGSEWTPHPLPDGVLGIPADIDLDGDIDLVRDTTWLRNEDGTGDRWLELDLRHGMLGADVHFAADLEGDGDIDLLAFDGTQWVWIVRVEEDALAWNWIRVDDSPAVPTAVCDLDGDGDLDLVRAPGRQSGDGGIRWLENRGSSLGWRTHVIHPGATTYLDSIHPGDLDGDGDQDLISGGYGPTGANSLIWFEQRAVVGS